MGGINGMFAELDRDATVARLRAGKAHWCGMKRVEGRWPYGEHPSREYDAERAIVARIRELHAKGISSRAIVKLLSAEGTRTRYGCEFHRSCRTSRLRCRIGCNDCGSTRPSRANLFASIRSFLRLRRFDPSIRRGLATSTSCPSPR